MLKSTTRAISAIVAAAAIAGAMTVVPGASEKVSASAPLNSGKGDRLDIRPIGPNCSGQAWPYYEPRCVKDHRQAMSKAKSIRIVTADRLKGETAANR